LILAYNLVQTDNLESQRLLFQASDKVTDFPSIYYSNNKKDKQYIIPVFNIVIKLDEGKITGVVW